MSAQDMSTGTAGTPTAGSSTSTTDSPSFVAKLKDLSIINPYKPSPEVDWKSVSLESGSNLRYKDPVAASEFRRFVYRDLSLVIIGAMYVAGSLFYPTVMYPAGLYGLANYIAATMILTVLPVDAYLHIKQTLTSQEARVRQAMQYVLGVACTLCTNIGCFYPYYKMCNQIVEISVSLGFRTESHSEERVLNYCQNTLNPFTYITITITLMAFPLPPVAMLSLFVLEWIQEITSRPIVLRAGDRYETGPEIANKVLGSLTLSCMCLSLLVFRYRASMASFEQAVRTLQATQAAAAREEEVDMLLCAMLPSSALARIMMDEPVQDYTTDATVLFSDMVQFTAWSSKRTAREVVEMLNVLCMQFDAKATSMGVQKVKTIGDAYWAVTGLPEYDEEHAEKMCDFANKMHDIVEESNKKHREWEGVRLRIGIHSGPLSGGILGTKQMSYEVFGHTTHLAEEVEKNGVPCRVTVSQDTLITYIGIEGAKPTKQMNVDGEVYDLFALPRTDIATIRQTGLEGQGAAMNPTPHHGDGQHRERRRSDPSGMLTDTMSRRSGFSVSRVSERHSQLSKKSNTKAMREQFMKAQAAKAQLGGQAGSESLAQIQERYSARKWRQILYTFRDEGVEAKYTEFAMERQMVLRKASRFGTLGLIAMMMIGVGIEGGTFSSASIAFFVVAIALVLLDLGLSYVAVPPRVSAVKHRQYFALAQVVLHHIATIFIFLAGDFMPMLSSVTTNDITYLHGTLTMLLSVGNIGLVPAAALIIANVTILVPIFVVLIWDIVVFTSGIIFLIQSNLIICFFLIVLEKQYRQQFLERRVAQYFREKQEEKNQQQHALLSAIVPGHVIDALMVWLSTSMSAEDSIVRRIPQICVCFVRLAERPVPRVEGAAGRGELQENSSNTTMLGVPSGEQPGDSCATSASSAMLESLLENDESQVDHSFDWLNPAHCGVDEIVKHYPALDKIKTIGELVMLAGPFREEHTIGEAADQLVAAVSEMRSVAQVSSGMHVGEIVGAVLGTSRLCFDIFGDTVNTSSRALSTGEDGDVTVTEEFYNTFVEFQSTNMASPSTDDAYTSECNGSPTTPAGGHCYAQGFVFSEQIQRAAKGKGHITVRTVSTMGMAAVPEKEPERSHAMEACS